MNIISNKSISIKQLLSFIVRTLGALHKDTHIHSIKIKNLTDSLNS